MSDVLVPLNITMYVGAFVITGFYDRLCAAMTGLSDWEIWEEGVADVGEGGFHINQACPHADRHHLSLSISLPWLFLLFIPHRHAVLIHLTCYIQYNACKTHKSTHILKTFN